MFNAAAAGALEDTGGEHIGALAPELFFTVFRAVLEYLVDELSAAAVAATVMWDFETLSKTMFTAGSRTPLY